MTEQDLYQQCRVEALQGSIPVELRLADVDITSSYHTTTKVFLLLTRYSYLAKATAEAIAHFRSIAVQFDSEVWFDYEGEVLKSHWPLGVLFDHHARSAPLPWVITAHFQPLRGGTDKAMDLTSLRLLFFHQIKQALHLLHGRTTKFYELTSEQQRDLWEVAAAEKPQSDFDRVAHLFDPVLPSGPEAVKLLPLRVVRRDGVVVQKPSRVLREDGSERSLREVLREDFGMEEELQEEEEELFIQGISISKDSPAYTLWTLLRHQDLFLYICL